MKQLRSLELDQIRTEIAALSEVLARAKRLKDKGPETDSKLGALQACLKKAEFHELKDGRGKLLIFTEHRDTLKHLKNASRGMGLLHLRNPRRHEPA